MKRVSFSSDGKLIGVDGAVVGKRKTGLRPQRNFEEFDKENNEESAQLIKSEDLQFLKDEKPKVESVFEKPYWSLYEKDKPLTPLEFSNGKTQENVVQEIVELIERGKKVIFLHGVCGTGKSAIALNVARALGKTAIVVPIKSLQKQYEKDYMGDKYVLNKSGKKMKIAMITGRDNHDSIIEEGKSCAWPFLPDTIRITEKNTEKLKRFYAQNPYLNNKSMPSTKGLKRIAIAPANPYWSPILPAEIEIKHFTDAKKKRYVGMNGKEFIFYHRKSGCSYYDQYLSYIESDVIIFNSAKYLAEVAIGRKPQTEVDIIDEADEFLDSFSNTTELNLTMLKSALKILVPDSLAAQESVKRISQLIDLEETNKRALGIDEDKVYHINETKIADILSLFSKNPELEVEIELDDMNYANAALEAARDFQESFQDTYLTYRKEEDNLYVKLVTTNLSKKFKEIVDGNKALVLMSGTLHSDNVLKHIFGISDFAKVDAETLNQGAIEIMRVGGEFDCRYSNFQSGTRTREDYLLALAKTVERAKKPVLIHVNAFSDLPSVSEAIEHEISNVASKEELLALQGNDANGERIGEFKSGKFDKLFTTKCSRGIDFPGETCNSVVFTKYPNPNVKDVFWKILQNTHPDWYWEFYRDKARREFLQRIYRAVRSKDDHVFVLSPDIRVLEAVREMQVRELGL